MLSLARMALEDLMGRFKPFIAHSAGDLDACRALAESVRFEELRRKVGGSPFDTSAFLESDGESKVVGVRDRMTGKVVGCVRGTFVRSLLRLPAVHREYRLDLLPSGLAERTAIAARLVVDPAYRKTAASLTLMRALYRIGLEDGLVLFAVSCEPALVSMYQRVGYRAIAPVWAKAGGGFRVPVFMGAHDEAHLAHIRSPLLPLLRATPRPWPTDASRWLQEHTARLSDDIGVQRWEPSRHHPALDSLVWGLSPQAREALLTHAVQVRTSPNDLIFREGDGVRSLILVLEGSVEARRATSTRRLGPGSVLGLTSVITDQERRASVVTVEAGSLLFLSRSALTRVRAAEDKAILWERLARLAALRVQ